MLYHPAEYLQWIRLARAQEFQDRNFLVTAQFDKVLGDCEAVTDIPCAEFAHELIAAYPSATVILNYRDDIDAWHASVTNTIERVTTFLPWYDWLIFFFHSESFWRQRWVYWVWTRHFTGDFQNRGRQWYRDHYRGVEKSKQESERPYLRWKLEDGWQVFYPQNIKWCVILIVLGNRCASFWESPFLRGLSQVAMPQTNSERKCRLHA